MEVSGGRSYTSLREELHFSARLREERRLHIARSQTSATQGLLLTSLPQQRTCQTIRPAPSRRFVLNVRDRTLWTTDSRDLTSSWLKARMRKSKPLERH
ncbi:hypothetical protein EYF80_068365 [Liparis tanakae]|uniref:Uncharacterized protein n=1 Tax=Liparis tanakae TaxID=230148 RepID=A0A4Z2DYB4_9TELE|nr:hypothetical protein EYF80_068365 [Liparis tanakae]